MEKIFIIDPEYSNSNSLTESRCESVKNQLTEINAILETGGQVVSLTPNKVSSGNSTRTFGSWLIVVNSVDKNIKHETT